MGTIYHPCHLVKLNLCFFLWEQNVISEHSKWLPGGHFWSNLKIDDTRWKSAKKCPNNVFSTWIHACTVFELRDQIIIFDHWKWLPDISSNQEIDDTKWKGNNCPANIFNQKPYKSPKLQHKTWYPNMKNGCQVAIFKTAWVNTKIFHPEIRPVEMESKKMTMFLSNYIYYQSYFNPSSLPGMASDKIHVSLNITKHHRSPAAQWSQSSPWQAFLSMLCKS